MKLIMQNTTNLYYFSQLFFKYFFVLHHFTMKENFSVYVSVLAKSLHKKKYNVFKMDLYFITLFLTHKSTVDMLVNIIFILLNL